MRERSCTFPKDSGQAEPSLSYIILNRLSLVTSMPVINNITLPSIADCFTRGGVCWQLSVMTHFGFIGISSIKGNVDAL